jgi:hypothetical protein
MTPLRFIGTANALILLVVYAFAYLPGGDGTGKIAALLAPFILSGLNLCLGLFCVVLMFALKRGDPTGSALADRSMQAFMITCAAVFAFGIPACFYGLSRLP